MSYFNSSGGHWISEVIDRGAYIKLEDGSLWEIDQMDKLDTMLWLSSENVSVVPNSKGMPGFNYLLINGSQKNKASAKLVSQH